MDINELSHTTISCTVSVVSFTGENLNSVTKIGVVKHNKGILPSKHKTEKDAVDRHFCPCRLSAPQCMCDGTHPS